MYKKLLLILFCSLPILLFAQTIQYPGDTIDFVPGRRSINAEMRLRNATRNIVGGVLANKGGGLLAFRKVLTKVNDSTYLILDDTLHLPTFITSVVQTVSADWNTILNKPNFAPVALSNDFNDLLNKPAIPAQFHPIQGIGIAISGTYPNLTFTNTGSSSGSGTTNVFNSYDTVTYNNTFAAGVDTMLFVNIANKFGLVGDGITDNYTNWQAFIAWLNARHGYADCYLPDGDYYINRIRQTGRFDTIIGQQTQDTTGIIDTTGAGPFAANNIKNGVIKDCRNFIIRGGNGARISVKGDFYRAYTYLTTDGKYKQSGYNQVVPLVFTRDTNFTVQHIELNGNNQLMTSAPGVNEGDGNGMEIKSCINGTFEDIYTHHWQTDGIIISSLNSSSPLPENIVGRQIVSLYNGRQAGTFMCANSTFYNCEFSHTRDTANGMMGAFNGYLPGLGVDIEPDYAPDAVGGKVRNLTFYNCKWKDNRGGAVSAVLSNRISDVTLDGGSVDNEKYDNKIPIRFAMYGYKVINMHIDLGYGDIYPLFHAANNAKETFGEYRNNTITAKSEGIVTGTGDGVNYPITFSDNWVIGKHDTSFHGYFPFLQAPIIHTGNHYVFDSGLYTGSSQMQGMVRNMDITQGNTYQSQLGSNNATYIVSFTGSNANNERFDTSTAIGIQGGLNYFKNGATAYSRGNITLPNVVEHNLGSGNILKEYWGNGIPTTNTYKINDIVNEIDPNTGIKSYSCKVAGVGAAAQFDTLFLGHTVVSSGTGVDLSNYYNKTQSDARYLTNANLNNYLLGTDASATYQPIGSYEIATNKASSISISTTQYPTVKAVKDYAEANYATISNVDSAKANIRAEMAGISGSGGDASTLNSHPGGYYLDYDNFINKPNLSGFASIAALNNYLLIADTAAMLSPYLRANIAAATYVSKVTGKGLSTEDYTTAEQTKLAGIASGATANSSDATLLARANHTGIQAASTITEDAIHRFATDAEKTTWNGKQDALGFTPYNATNPSGYITSSALSPYATTSALTSHTGNTSNPHSVTAAQVGLGNVDNTSDANKPVSTMQATAIAGKQPLATKLTDVAASTLTVSSASTLTLAYSNDYVFSGTTSTYTLPAIDNTKTGRYYSISISNRGTGNIVVNAASGLLTLYAGFAASSFIIPAGSNVDFMPDGTYLIIKQYQ